MARAGDVIENPMTGERITFLKTASDTGGEMLAFEYLAPAHTAGPPLHVHPYQEERFVEILSGKLRARMGKDERSFGKGESLTVSSGTPHTWRNDGEDAVRMLVQIRPALRMEEAFETTFLTPVIVAFLWQYIYAPGGALNRMLELLHLGWPT